MGTTSTLAALLICVCMLGAAPPERPRDPWVFRCVLDEHPRMVVIALHEELWVAFDATTCSLYKAWQGDVKFDGAVYTTVHGPQPTSQGETYFDGPQGDVWYIRRDEQLLQPQEVRWRGYELRNNAVTLRYALHLPDGTQIEIEEQPEVRVEDDTLIFNRSFNVHGAGERDRVWLKHSNVPEHVIKRVSSLSALGGASFYTETDFDDEIGHTYRQFLHLDSDGTSGVDVTLERKIDE